MFHRAEQAVQDLKILRDRAGHAVGIYAWQMQI